MTTATQPTVEEAMAAITPYLKPGFAQEWRDLTLALGFGRLGRALCRVVVPETNGHHVTLAPPKPTLTQRRTADLCPWGRKISKSGTVTRNTRHTCSAVCKWTYREALDWAASTPYHYPDTDPRISVLSGCASCLCKLPLHSHSVPASIDGELRGMHHQKCEFESREAVAPNI